MLVHSLEGGRNGETARCGETEARTFTSKNPKAWLTGPHSMHIRKKNNVERTNGTHSYGWSATVGILIVYSVLLIVPHLYFTTLVPDAYVALASGFQIAMLGLAGSVLILIASISRSDTMRLRTLLRGGDVQGALFELLAWLVMLVLGRYWLCPLSVGMGLLLSAFVLAKMLIRVLSMLLSPSKYWNEYTSVLGLRFSSVVSGSAKYHQRYVQFRAWIDTLDARLSFRYIPLISCELTSTHVLVPSTTSGRIEDINLGRLKHRLVGLKTDVALHVRERAEVGQGGGDSGTEEIGTDMTVSSGSSIALPVVVFFEAPGRSVGVGDALLGVRKDCLCDGGLSASQESGLRDCYAIRNGAATFESDVAIERGELRDRALRSLETGSINDAVIAETALRRLFEEFLAVATTHESFCAAEARQPKRDYDGEPEWSELDDLMSDADAVVLSARRTRYDDVFERLEPMPYQFAVLAEQYRANRPFRRSCALMAREAIEMGANRKDDPAGTRNRQMAEFHIRMLSLLLYGVSSSLQRTEEWQGRWPWFVTEIDALFLEFCLILYQAANDVEFGQYVADQLSSTCSLVCQNTQPSRPALQSIDELRTNVPASQSEARCLIGDALRDLRVAASLIANGLATDDILGPHFPTSLIGTRHMGLRTVDLRGFIRGYALAQGLAEHDPWDFGFWGSSGDVHDYRDPHALVAIGAAGFLMVRGIQAPMGDSVLDDLRNAVDDQERALQLFGEGSIFYRTLQDAMHQRGRWPKSLTPNVEVLESWRSFAHDVMTATWLS